jgi:hypothetical protein
MKIKNHCQICKAINCYQEFDKHPSSTSYINMKAAVKPVLDKISEQFKRLNGPRYTDGSCAKHVVMPMDEVAKLNEAIQAVSKPYEYKVRVDVLLKKMVEQVAAQ